jgi:hypothetical protein
MRRELSRKLPVIGWREWLTLPEIGIGRIKAKIDSGARSSSIHAFDMNIEDHEGEEYVRFKIYPVQRRTTKVVETFVPVHEFRQVRSSNGQTDVRPVIITSIRLMRQEWPIELTLTDRSDMGFRMLLGREAFRSRFLLDAGNSYYGGKLKKKKSR